MRFRVLDVVTGAEHLVSARKPEAAAEAALGIRLVRGMSGEKTLRAKVYFEAEVDTTMVRLYQPLSAFQT